MKTLICWATVLTLFLVVSKTPAQKVLPILPSLVPTVGEMTDLKVVDRGFNHRVWQYKTSETTRTGQVREHLHSYTELATGMHYQENGQWKESEEVIEVDPDGGAKAAKGQHKAFFAGNINSDKAVELITRDNKILSSRILGLGYFDSATGQSVLISELKDAQGFIVPPNQVIYPDAFTDFKADVRYTYTLAGFEQDVILRAQPPTPADYGLNPNTTRLQLFTEFSDPPIPIKQKEQKGNVQTDRVLDFGAMQIGVGKAFSTSNEANIPKKTKVDKNWTKLDGRDFLIEELNFKAIEGELQALPLRPQAAIKPVANGVRHLVSNKPLLPVRKMAEGKEKKVVKVASLNNQSFQGFVLDYKIINAATNFTFKGDTTYYVTNSVYLSGTTTIEGGTVVKGRTNTDYVSIGILGPVKCQTDAYRPAVFTAKDDDSVGEIISGSSGNPNGYYWWSTFDITFGPVDFKNLRVGYSKWGIFFDVDETTNTVSNSQIFKCGSAIYGYYSTVLLRNLLIFNTDNAIIGEDTFRVEGEHLTVDRCNYLGVDWGNNSTAALTNSLIIAVTNWGSFSSLVTNNVSTASTPSLVFQTVGAGSHYLATNSVYRNAGTTNINAKLMADLRKKTTYPPIVYSNATIYTETTLNPQAQRDTDVPDLGYHYDPLDYVFGGTTASENLTFTSGTAVGWFWPSGGSGVGYGLHMADTKIVNFDGKVDAYNYWVRYNAVQEGGNGLWTQNSGTGGLTGTADQYQEDVGLSPEILMRFTRCSMLANPGYCHFRDDYGYLTVRATHCEFLGGALGAYGTGYYLTNCLLERSAAMNVEGWPGNEFHLRNCTFKGGSLSITPSYSEILASIKDCAFDGTTINTSGTPNIEYNYNAFLVGSNYTSPAGLNDVLVTNFNWQSSWLGNYYIPTNSTLTNKGSFTNAALAGLYHFTTQTNQVKEANSPLDIGYHYVAVDALGNPIDTDGDGIPDYLADKNGNGIFDLGEIPAAITIENPANGSVIH